MQRLKLSAEPELEVKDEEPRKVVTETLKVMKLVMVTMGLQIRVIGELRRSSGSDP